MFVGGVDAVCGFRISSDGAVGAFGLAYPWVRKRTPATLIALARAAILIRG